MLGRGWPFRMRVAHWNGCDVAVGVEWAFLALQSEADFIRVQRGQHGEQRAVVDLAGGACAQDPVIPAVGHASGHVSDQTGQLPVSVPPVRRVPGGSLPAHQGGDREWRLTKTIRIR